MVDASNVEWADSLLSCDDKYSAFRGFRSKSL